MCRREGRRSTAALDWQAAGMGVGDPCMDAGRWSFLCAFTLVLSRSALPADVHSSLLCPPCRSTPCA